MTKRSHNDSLDGDQMNSGGSGILKRPIYYRQNSVISRFESLRRQYSQKNNNNYYDPYQKEQVQQVKRKSMSDDDDNPQQQQQQTNEERPTKRRKSITSMVKNGVIQSVLFGSALALTAFDYLQPTLKRSTSLCSMEALTESSINTNNIHNKKNMRGHGVDFSCYFYQSPTFEKRVQKTEQLIRDICLDQQYAFNQHFRPSLHPREDPCWGLVNKDDYDVNFMTMPPPKPKRTFTYLQKPKNFFFSNTA